MPLSVLSALARLDIDPWKEAAELARLPGDAAIQRLASLIRALPDVPPIHPDPNTIAARLIGFLPRGPRSTVLTREASLSVQALSQSRAPMLYVMIFMAFLLGVQFFQATRQDPAQVDHSQVSGADSETSAAPSLKSAQ